MGILGAAVLCTALPAQTVLYGSGTQVVGSTTLINPATTYTRIYVVFPPQTSGNNNTNFISNVMKQSAIDGVTLQVPWNAVEQTSSPNQTDCRVLAPPMSNPDRCQADSTAGGWFHTYDWSAIDGTSGTPCSDTTANSSAQWFCDFPNGSGSFKQVNFELFGISNGPTNVITPSYVTTPSWVSATGASAQDVVNTINASGCAVQYPGSYTVPTFTPFQGDGNTPSNITVTWTSHPFVSGDIIWVSGLSNATFNVTTAAGAVVTWQNSSSFSYKLLSGSTGSMVFSNSSTKVVVARQSWPVPFETPYASAWQAFLKAAIYHFNNINNVTNNPPTWNFMQISSHIGYIRPGVATGGEAFPICTSSPPMSTYNPVTTWVPWYTTVNSTVQSANPQMQILYSINAGDPASQDATIATAEAGIAVGHYNAIGEYNGFGSQGLKQTDTSFLPTSCPQTGSPNTGNNWGCMFANYWSGASPCTRRSERP
jgi:hypothetical protein